MINKRIYVAVGEPTMSLSNGAKVVAMFPNKGDIRHNLALMDNGKLCDVPGARINGKGVARYLEECGYALGASDDSNVQRVANEVYHQMGVKYVQDAIANRACAIQQEFGGKTAFVVPFDPTKTIVCIDVAVRDGCTMVLETGVGIAGSSVSSAYGSERPFMDVNLLKNWLCKDAEEAAQAARLTEYGGPIEHAAFVLVNAGLATAEDTLALVPGMDVDKYCKGRLMLNLVNGDKLLIGISGLDLLEVVYYRGDAVLFKDDEGLKGFTLGDAVGALASVICRIQEQDQFASKPKRSAKKAA